MRQYRIIDMYGNSMEDFPYTINAPYLLSMMDIGPNNDGLIVQSPENPNNKYIILAILNDTIMVAKYIG